MKNVITEEKALEIVNEFIVEITQLDPIGILAVYLIGSLGGGYYRAGQSDIDTAIILRDDAAITRAQVKGAANRYFEAYQVPKGFGSVMIYEHDLYPPYQKSITDEFEFTVEIARLKTQGRLVYGKYDMAAVPMPTRDYFVRDAVIFTKWAAGAFGSDNFADLNLTSCVNTIFMQLRRYLIIDRGVFEFNKFRLIGEYLKTSPVIVDEEMFEFIDSYLRGEAVQRDDAITKLRAFTKRVSDYYNEKLLGL
jgi:predicted nucleotidyltransferase